MSAVLEAGRSPWLEVPLTEVADLLRGVSYHKSDAREEPAPGYLPVLRATNIQNARLILDSDLVYVAERNIAVWQRLRPGDIVVATSSGSRHLVGKSGQLQGAWDGSFGAFCAAIRPKPHIESRYLAFFLQSPRYWKQITKKALGVNINNLRRGDLESLSLPLPPIEDQRRIVAEIEKEFSRLDEAVTNLKRVKANLKRYKAAVLKAAVQGRIVPTEAELARREGRSYETGAQLLERILEARRQWKGKGKYKEPTPPNMSNLPDIPEGWTWASLDQLSWESSYGTSVKCSYEDQGPPVLRIPNVDKAKIDLGDLKFGPSSLKIAQAESVAPGDMLIIRTNGSKSLIGRAAIVLSAPAAPMTYASYLIRFRLAGVAAPARWISAVWQSSRIRSWIESKAATSAGQHNISMTVLATAAIPLPPLAEQHRLVAQIDWHLSLVQGIEGQVDTDLRRADSFRSTVLTGAFASN